MKFRMLALCLAFPLTSQAQNELFDSVGPPAGGFPAPGTQFTFPITIDFDVMSSVPEEISIEIPNSLSPTGSDMLLIPRVSRKRLAGYIEDISFPGCIDDEDESCPIIPDPNASPEDFSFIWYGRSDAKVLSLTWKHGSFVGYFQYENGHYRISTDKLVKVDEAFYLDQLQFDTFSPTGDRTIAKVRSRANEATKGAFGEDDKIDTLVLFSEGARTSANHNGDPLDCNDDDSITNLIDAAIVHSNGSHLASGPDGSGGTGMQHGEVYVRRLINLPLDPDDLKPIWDTEFDAWLDIVDNEAIEAERQQLGADIVVVFLADDDFNINFPDFALCGLADIPDTTDPDDPGNWSLSMAFVRENCQRQIPFIFTHEVGHLLGAQHALSQFPDADPLFPWAHGLHIENVVNTVMSNERFGPRVDWFSTPTRTHNGSPTGTIETENVAFMIADVMGPTVSNYLPLLDGYFNTGFEFNGACPNTVDWND